MTTPLGLARKAKHQIFLAQRNRELIRQARELRGSEQFRREYEMAAAGFDLPALPAMTGPCAIAVLGFLRLVRVGAPAGYEDPIRLV